LNLDLTRIFNQMVQFKHMYFALIVWICRFLFTQVCGNQMVKIMILSLFYEITVLLMM